MLLDVSKSRILIADPDPDIRHTLRIYFESNGHEVQTVELAGEVAKMARPWQPNAIVLSDEFRDADPFEIGRQLMIDTLVSHVPIIMLLHLSERRSRLQALEAGMADIIAKPFDIEELRLRVEAAIRLTTMRVGV